ncbi:MAG: ATP-binding protein [Solirubrobacteraceae bacterium]
MSPDQPPVDTSGAPSADRLRRRGMRIAALFLVFAVVLLGVGAWLLADSQSKDRSQLRERYATGATVASALIDSLFRVAFGSGVERAVRDFSGDISGSELDAYTRTNQSLYTAVLDADGKVVAASSRAPATPGEGLIEQIGKDGVALGGIEQIGAEESVESVTRYPVGKSVRYLVSGAPVATFRDFLGGSIQPLVRYGGEAYVLDGGGRVLGAASASDPKRPPPPSGELVKRAGTQTDGLYDGDGGEQYFAVQPVTDTKWHVVVSAPTAELYEPASGVSRWLPWVVLAILGLALVAIGVLVRRAVDAGARIAVVNSQLEASQDRLRDRALELQSSNAELQRSNAELEQFAYVASHDLSAPLRAVAGFSQLLGVRYKGKLDDDADQFIGHMQDGVERMQRIIDDLLAYSRVDRSGLQPEAIDLDKILDEVLQSLRSDIEAFGADVQREPLGAACGEPGQLSQVLQNLVANGMKFTAEGVKPVVHVSAARREGRVFISVRDNGIGIDPGHAAQIFKMFQRLHSAEEYEGTGIGLAIAKKIVDRHGGRIDIEPAPGGGTVFTFDIPAELPR